MSTDASATRLRNGGVLFADGLGPREPGAWKRLLFPAIWLVYLGQTASGVNAHSSGAAAVAGYVIIGLFAVGYVWALASTRWHRRRYWAIFAAMVALTAAETVFAREDAFVMCVFLVVLVMAGLVFTDHARAAVPAVAALTVVATALPALVPSWDAAPDWAMLVTLPLVALAMFGFFTIIKASRELSEVRAEVARLAAENERNRIARDLHDLLGHSLTAITVKAGLARRLATRDPERASEEIAEVERLSRSALADVRAAVAGYRDVTLAGELASAREVLQAAGIDARAPEPPEVVAPEHAELFGWVVREGVTNVVRHSRARHCVIALGPTWLEIEDDGRGGPPEPGSGLAGLRERVAAAGGVLRAGGGPEGWRLRVEMGGVLSA